MKFQESHNSDQGVENFDLSLLVMVENIFLYGSQVGISKNGCAHGEQCCHFTVMLRQHEPTMSMQKEKIPKNKYCEIVISR